MNAIPIFFYVEKNHLKSMNSNNVKVSFYKIFNFTNKSEKNWIHNIQISIPWRLMNVSLSKKLKWNASSVHVEYVFQRETHPMKLKTNIRSIWTAVSFA